MPGQGSLQLRGDTLSRRRDEIHYGPQGEFAGGSMSGDQSDWLSARGTAMLARSCTRPCAMRV